jgi:hypothetical protein
VSPLCAKNGIYQTQKPDPKNPTALRAPITHPLADGTYVATDLAREEAIWTHRNYMEQWQRDNGDIHEFEVFPAAGVNETVKVAYSDTTHAGKEVAVSGLGSPTANLGITILHPASGHNGMPNMESWALADKVDLVAVYYKDATGSEVDDSHIFLAKAAISLGVITAQEAVIPMRPGFKVRVELWRTGYGSSLGGPPGYDNGREIRIEHDGT